MTDDGGGGGGGRGGGGLEHAHLRGSEGMAESIYTESLATNTHRPAARSRGPKSADLARLPFCRKQYAHRAIFYFCVHVHRYRHRLLELAASPYEGNGASPLSDGRPPLFGGAEAPEEKQRGRLQQNQKEKLAVFYTK
jgi:hypothetical protein